MAEHSHGHDAHGSVDETPVSNSSIAGWGVVMMVIFFGSAAMLTSVFSRITDDAINDKVLSVGSPELQQLREHETRRLSTYGYVDKDKQLAHIPIEDGIKRVIAEAQGSETAPASAPAPTPTAAPAPAAAPAPTAAPAPAPTAAPAPAATPAHAPAAAPAHSGDAAK